MDQESSNDVVLIECDQNHDVSDGPFIKILKSLITNDTKENTVLTNAQLVNILQEEFQLNINELHELEVEIYLNVVKKYLKDWPEWDNFEKAVLDLKAENNDEALKDTIQQNYESLKNYLNSMLDVAKLLAPNVVKKLPEKPKVYDKTQYSKESKHNVVVMEVHATRSQLDTLILRQPTVNNNIFNCIEPQIQMYSTNWLSLESILNMCGVKTDIEIHWSESYKLLFTYENKHRSHLKLVNKTIQVKLPNSQLNEEWQTKQTKPTLGKIVKEDLLDIFEQYIFKGSNLEWRPILRNLHKTLKNITKSMPSSITVPGEFRRYLTRHNFVRYMCKDNDDDESSPNHVKYDLWLQEDISPLCQIYIALQPVSNKEDVVKVTCTQCQKLFTGPKIVRDVEFHFRNSHNNELDWRCTYCYKTIPSSNLTEMHWQHECISNELQFHLMKS